MTPDDLDSVYLHYDKSGLVMLWCDGKSSENSEKYHCGKQK